MSLHLHKIASISTNAPRGNAAYLDSRSCWKRIGEEVYIDCCDLLKGTEVHFSTPSYFYKLTHDTEGDLLRGLSVYVDPDRCMDCCQDVFIDTFCL